MDDRPANALDRAVWHLERALNDRAEHPIRRLRAAIQYQRSRGKFDEERIIHELDHIETRASIAADDIDQLATKLMKEAP